MASVEGAASLDRPGQVGSGATRPAGQLCVARAQQQSELGAGATDRLVRHCSDWLMMCDIAIDDARAAAATKFFFFLN